MDTAYRDKYKWWMLALLALSGTFVTAIPFSCMPALFEEIALDLNLDLVQIGTVWGMGNLAGIFVSLIGGILGDRISVKWLIAISCILVGVTGALRGLSTDFVFLSVTMLLNGVIRLILPVNITRATGLWFRGSKNFGMAMGVGAMGMGLGLSLGPLLSATVVSPWLGGWQNTLFFYGALSVLIGVIWIFVGKEPPLDKPADDQEPLKATLLKLLKMKSVWIIGITFMLRTSSMMGMTGYLPTYLKNLGWVASNADGTLAAFYAISTLCVVPLSSLSDRIGTRKLILMLGIITNTISLGLLPLVGGGWVLALMLLSGIFMDGYMAINTTVLMETKGIGAHYSGAALGIIFTIGSIGNVISPPVGNSFANIHEGLPFTFWAVLSVLGLISLYFVKETGWRKRMLGKSHVAAELE